MGQLILWTVISALMVPAFSHATAWRWRAPRRDSEEWPAYYARIVGLPLTEELNRPVSRRIAAQEQWSRYGGFGGLAVAVLVLLVAGGRESFAPLILSATILGTTLGGVLAILTGKNQLAPDAPRYARAEATSVRDYVPGGELLSVRLAPVAAVAVGVAAAVILEITTFGRPEDGVWRGLLWALWVSAGSAVVVWAAWEITARYVLAQPQRATSELELAWDDQGRSQALRNLAALPIFLAFLTCLTSLMAVGAVVTASEVREGAMGETLTAGSAMFLVAAAAALIVTIPTLVSAVRKPRQHVLGRLWEGVPGGPAGPSRATEGPA